MAPVKTDSSPPGEVQRLRKEIHEKELAANEKRFNAIEKELWEVKRMAAEHECRRAADFVAIEKTFAAIEKSFAKGEQNFGEIEKRFDRSGSIKFWGIIGSVIALVIAVAGAVYAFSASATTQEVHTKKLEMVDGKLGKVEQDVTGLKVSFQLMEEQGRKTQEKIERNFLTPDKLEEAVRKGLKK